MRKALINGTVILDVVDEQFDAHPALVWVDVPDGTKAGQDLYVNGAVVKPPVPSHNEVIDAQINAAESELRITPRALREFMLMVLAFAHIDPSANPKFVEIAQLDAAIQTLRGQRT